ncbi:MAG: glycoside hydrolase family 99-like domain-containing protein, partial [Kiritimatiellae bacterium]|nr:glycoside hydrolase family 99-like domain-containing protein [Kiritimatiellia bacterium]
MRQNMYHKRKIIHGCAVFAVSFAAAAGFAACASAAGYDVAAYVWPAYQPEPRWKELGIFDAGKGEWQSVWEARPKWEGHEQPRKPLWGYENEADPKVVEKKIDAAVAHGVNVFIYDWYWYGGRPFLEDALDKGFLGAPNNGKMKFFIMWANHNVVKLWDNKAADKEWNKPIWRAGVDAEEFRKISRRWMEMYFSRPNYYRISGKPVLMIYEVATFVRGIGGMDKAAEALATFR